jgi:hypothetical protein
MYQNHKGYTTAIYRPNYRNPYKRLECCMVSNEPHLGVESRLREKQLCTALSCTPLSPYLGTRIAMVDLSYARTADFLEFLDESVCLVEVFDVVAASYAFSDEKNVRYCASASHVR